MSPAYALPIFAQLGSPLDIQQMLQLSEEDLKIDLKPQAQANKQTRNQKQTNNNNATNKQCENQTNK